jgi:hypothetical protein
MSELSVLYDVEVTFEGDKHVVEVAGPTASCMALNVVKNRHLSFLVQAKPQYPNIHGKIELCYDVHYYSGLGITNSVGCVDVKVVNSKTLESVKYYEVDVIMKSLSSAHDHQSFVLRFWLTQNNQRVSHPVPSEPLHVMSKLPRATKAKKRPLHSIKAESFEFEPSLESEENAGDDQVPMARLNTRQRVISSIRELMQELENEEVADSPPLRKKQRLDAPSTLLSSALERIGKDTKSNISFWSAMKNTSPSEFYQVFHAVSFVGHEDAPAQVDWPTDMASSIAQMDLYGQPADEMQY